MINFRPATISDAYRLWQWRNDPETRANSRTTGDVKFDDHLAWLKASLENPERKIWIAEAFGIQIGTIREDGDELSWTVAPHCRGMGFGRDMLQAFVAERRGPWRCEIKADNAASRRMAEVAGVTITAL